MATVNDEQLANVVAATVKGAPTITYEQLVTDVATATTLSEDEVGQRVRFDEVSRTGRDFLTEKKDSEPAAKAAAGKSFVRAFERGDYIAPIEGTEDTSDMYLTGKQTRFFGKVDMPRVGSKHTITARCLKIVEPDAETEVAAEGRDVLAGLISEPASEEPATPEASEEASGAADATEEPESEPLTVEDVKAQAGLKDAVIKDAMESAAGTRNNIVSGYLPGYAADKPDELARVIAGIEPVRDGVVNAALRDEDLRDAVLGGLVSDESTRAEVIASIQAKPEAVKDIVAAGIADYVADPDNLNQVVEEVGKHIEPTKAIVTNAMNHAGFITANMDWLPNAIAAEDDLGNAVTVRALTGYIKANADDVVEKVTAEPDVAQRIVGEALGNADYMAAHGGEVAEAVSKIPELAYIVTDRSLKGYFAALAEGAQRPGKGKSGREASFRSALDAVVENVPGREAYQAVLRQQDARDASTEAVYRSFIPAHQLEVIEAAVDATGRKAGDGPTILTNFLVGDGRETVAERVVTEYLAKIGPEAAAKLILDKAKDAAEKVAAGYKAPEEAEPGPDGAGGASPGEQPTETS